MSLYTNFETKVTKIAKKVAFIKRNKFPIIGVFSTLLAFLFIMLGVSGTIQNDLSLNKEEYVYGETLAYEKASAFISSVHYEYAQKSDNPTWSEVVPTTVGNYYMRTYTYNGYKVRRYGATKEFTIVPKEINLLVTSQSVVYGEEPLTNAQQVLNRGDKIDSIPLIYDNLSAPSNPTDTIYSNVEIDLNSLKIVNEVGVDVTSSYKINTDKYRIRINRRSITLSSNSETKDYDGTPLANSKVDFLYGSLAKGDYFERNPQTNVSLTTVSSAINEITPGKDELQIINPTLGNVTHLYNINYQEGFLTVNKKDLIIKGPIYRTTYNGEYQTPPVNSYNASSISVSGLAPTDRIENVQVSFNGGSQLYGEHDFKLSYRILDRNGNDASNNYYIIVDTGRMIIEKKNLYISPILNSYDNFYEGNQKYSREYDGSSTRVDNISSEGLCANDSISIISRPNFLDPGTYANISDGLNVRVTNSVPGKTTQNVTSNGYNIIKVSRSLEITKRNITLNVSELNLFETSTSINNNLISYSITSGSLVTNHRIIFNPKRSLFEAGSYDFKDCFNVSIVNNSGSNVEGYYNITNNNPKINIERAKYALQINNIVRTYSGVSQTVTASIPRLSSNTTEMSIIVERSNLPSNRSNEQIGLRSTLTDVSKHYFDRNDIISFSSSYRISVNKNGTTTGQNLTLYKENVDFEFISEPSFEIQKRAITVTLNPPVKYYDGNYFDPNVVLNNFNYRTISGTLPDNHQLKFVSINPIKNVGTYTSNELQTAYKLIVVDSNDNDKTSNYELNYSYSQPLVIKRANLTITIRDKSTSLTSTRTVGDLLYKTYNDEETDIFDSNSNDGGYSGYRYIYSYSSNITDDYSLNTSGFNLNLGIDPAKDVGTYDIVVKSFRFSTSNSDIYNTVFDSSLNRDCIDVTISNGSSAYEIRKKNITFTIPNLTFICDGSAIDYNFELDTSSIKNQLLTNHTLEVTGNSITNEGTYTASQANIDFKIYDANMVDVTSNYQLNWSNKSSFRISAENARVTLSRSRSFNPPSRTYDGTNWDEQNFYDSITSDNARDDTKHSYSFEFRFKNGFIPDSYYDAGIINLPQNNPESQYTDLYCTKTYSNGNSYSFIVRSITYNIINDKVVATSQRNLDITINDEVYWISNDEYTFDLTTNAGAIRSIDGLAYGDQITSLSLRSGHGINGNDLGNGVSTITFDVSNYSSFFDIEIYSPIRGKTVTNNYIVNYSGSITYSKAKLSLRLETQNLTYNGDEQTIGNANPYINKLPTGATYEITYNFITPTGNFTSTDYKASKVGNYSYTISDVKVNYNGKDITSFVEINYPIESVGRTIISNASLTISTGTFKLGFGFPYNLAEPKVIKANGFDSPSDFTKKFTIQFGHLVDDPNGLFTINEAGNLIPLDYGNTQNQIRDIRIINNTTGEDVTDCFDVEWIIGVIEIYDIEIY